MPPLAAFRVAAQTDDVAASLGPAIRVEEVDLDQGDEAFSSNGLHLSSSRLPRHRAG